MGDSEKPQTNGLENGLNEEERMKMRPADIDADVKEMERRKRVEMIMNSKLFREELERIIELQMKDGNGPAGLLQQISDMMGIQSGKLHTTHMFRGSNCVTPINDIRGVESMGYEKGEKNLRCKLASVFRLMDLYGWSQGINNQITARLNQDEEHFLVNPHGMLFNEITASSLVKVDMQGNIVEAGTTNFSVNTQGFLLHSAIHASRPDVNCVIHIKTPSVLAVSSLKCGLLPLCHEALVIGEVSQHPFVCGIFEPEEREKIIRNLGPSNKILLLHNHGAVCCGATVEEAFYNVYNTVLACETQVKLMPIGVENLVLINDETRKQVYDAAHRAPDAAAASTDKKTKQFRVGEMEFEALIRMLDNAGFRTGYIYRHPLVKGELPKPKNDVEVPPAVSSLGYLIEQEELYKQGNWKKYVDGRNRLDRTKWLNSPNVYQKVEILETGTSDPKKITKWVAESSPTHSSTPVKIESALQFVPKGTNPKEFKKLQQQIKENRRADKITSGPQSHILEGVSWEEAKKLQDANITQTGDQVILVGAASKGIIQRNYQHNALVYKTPYAKNPFDSMSDKEIEDYKQLVERKQRGDTDYEESQSESEAISSSRQDALRHLKSPLMSPQSATSETEEESRDEPRVLRIETKTAPRPIQAEVVLSDAESDSIDARVERSHSARYPKAEKPESVTLMNSFRKSWSLKREKDKNKDTEKCETYRSRNLHPSLILSDCEQDRTESLHCCVARIKQITHKPVIVDLCTKALRPLLKSASDPCNLSTFATRGLSETPNGRHIESTAFLNKSLSCSNSVNMSDLQRRLRVRKKLLHSAKMKFLGFCSESSGFKKEKAGEKTTSSPMCALISEIRETISEIMSPERSKKSEESLDDCFSSLRWIERPKFVSCRPDGDAAQDYDRIKGRVSLGKSFDELSGLPDSLDEFDEPIYWKPLDDFKTDFSLFSSEILKNEQANGSFNCTDGFQREISLEKATGDKTSFKSQVDENQNEEPSKENLACEEVKAVTVSDEEATYTIGGDSLLQTYSFTETTETEWYYDKTIMKLENSQTVVEVKEMEIKENLDVALVKNVDTGIDTDFTSEKEIEQNITDHTAEEPKELDELEIREDVDADVPALESSGMNKSSETDSSFLKSSSGRTSNDVDTSCAFKTETENSDKVNEKVTSPVQNRNEVGARKVSEGAIEHVKDSTEESSDNGDVNSTEIRTLDNLEGLRAKQFGDNCTPKLPGIPESPEFTNIDTEDAPVTSSSKDTSPEVAGNAERHNGEDPMDATKVPETEEKEKDHTKRAHKSKKGVKSSTKITVKKEVKESIWDEPVVSEIKLTIKNSKPCQSEKYEVKIQDVTNTSEELSRSVSSVGENADTCDNFDIVEDSCVCEAHQELEVLQEEVSSTIDKLQVIENYFEDEIKKHLAGSPDLSDKNKKQADEFIIEYNYREFEEILNESREVHYAKVRNISPEQEGKKEDEVGRYQGTECVEYFVSSLQDDFCKEIEVGWNVQEKVEENFIRNLEAARVSQEECKRVFPENVINVIEEFIPLENSEFEKNTTGEVAAKSSIGIKIENDGNEIAHQFIVKNDLFERSESLKFDETNIEDVDTESPDTKVKKFSASGFELLDEEKKLEKKSNGQEQSTQVECLSEEIEWKVKNGTSEKFKGDVNDKSQLKEDMVKLIVEILDRFLIVTPEAEIGSQTTGKLFSGALGVDPEEQNGGSSRGLDEDFLRPTIDRNSMLFQLLKFFHEKSYVGRKGVTRAGTGTREACVFTCLLGSLGGHPGESSANDVFRFVWSTEDPPADSFAELGNVERVNSATNSIGSALEGEAAGGKKLADADESKPKRSESMFKVTIATATKKEIFINYSADSSSTFNVSSDHDHLPCLDNSYVKTDDVNEDFENLSSENAEFFSVGSPEKMSADSSFGSTSSALDVLPGGDLFCCCDCEPGAKSPRALAIIQEVDESEAR